MNIIFAILFNKDLHSEENPSMIAECKAKTDEEVKPSILSFSFFARLSYFDEFPTFSDNDVFPRSPTTLSHHSNPPLHHPTLSFPPACTHPTHACRPALFSHTHDTLSYLVAHPPSLTPPQSPKPCAHLHRRSGSHRPTPTPTPCPPRPLHAPTEKSSTNTP